MPIRGLYMHEKNCLECVGFKYFSCEIFDIPFHPSDDALFLQKDFSKSWLWGNRIFGKLGYKENDTADLS